MSGPGDALEVINALRLGWYVAEVRGRNRPGGPRPSGDGLLSRGDHVLPLRIERTAASLYQLDAHAQDTLTAQSDMRALWIQLTTAAVSLVLLIALIALILNGSANSLLKAFLGVAGGAGLSAATVQTRLKTTTQGLLSRFRQDAYTDLVAVAIAEAPDKPGARHPRRVVTEEVRKRTLTTVADATVP
jgi:hypothetical protein